MALSFDWANLVVESDASITDLVVFHQALRAAEDDAVGMLYPTIHTWKALDLGGGAYFYQADFINGWKLKFPVAGSYSINGNLNATIIPVAGVYVERKTSAAFTTTAVGGSGPTPEDIADAVWQHTSATDLLDRVTMAQAILRNKTITDPSTGLMTVYDTDGATPLLTAALYQDAAGTTPYAGAGAERREMLN